MVFPAVMYGCESWTIKKVEHWRIRCFWTVVLEKTLESPWTTRRFNQSILNENSPECSLVGLLLKLKPQYFGHLMWRTDSWKDPDAGKDWGQEEKGMKEDEMVWWHHQLNRHEFEYTLGVGDGQRGLACSSPWGHKESDMTEWLNWTEVKYVWTVEHYLNSFWPSFLIFKMDCINQDPSWTQQNPL